MLLNLFILFCYYKILLNLFLKLKQSGLPSASTVEHDVPRNKRFLPAIRRSGKTKERKVNDKRELKRFCIAKGRDS